MHRVSLGSYPTTFYVHIYIYMTTHIRFQHSMTSVRFSQRLRAGSNPHEALKNWKWCRQHHGSNSDTGLTHVLTTMEEISSTFIFKYSVRYAVDWTGYVYTTNEPTRSGNHSCQIKWYINLINLHRWYISVAQIHLYSTKHLSNVTKTFHTAVLILFYTIS